MIDRIVLSDIDSWAIKKPPPLPSPTVNNLGGMSAKDFMIMVHNQTDEQTKAIKREIQEGSGKRPLIIRAGDMKITRVKPNG